MIIMFTMTPGVRLVPGGSCSGDMMSTVNLSPDQGPLAADLLGLTSPLSSIQ